MVPFLSPIDQMVSAQGACVMLIRSGQATDVSFAEGVQDAHQISGKGYQEAGGIKCDNALGKGEEVYVSL